MVSQNYLEEISKIVNSFKPYVGYTGSYTFRTAGKFSVGIYGGYMSTGGRLDNQDYSGEIREDELIRGYSLGTFFQRQLNDSKKWPFFLTLHMGNVLSHVTIRDYVRIGSNESDASASGNSINYSFKPGFLLRKNIGGFLLQSGIRYEFQFHGKIHMSDGNGNTGILTSASGDPVTVQWDGLRLFVGLGFGSR